MIFLRLYPPLSAALFILKTWPSGSPNPHYHLLRRPNEEPRLDESASRSTGIVFSIWTNMRILFYVVDLTRLIFISIFFCSASFSSSTSLPLFLGSSLTAFFYFWRIYLHRRQNFSSSQGFTLCVCFLMGPIQEVFVSSDERFSLACFHLLYASAECFLFSALSNWNVFTQQSMSPSSAASCAPLLLT